MPKQASDIKLSILILSIPQRIEKLKILYEQLSAQITGDNVEVLTLVDNKSFHIYEKRNELLDMARGEYTAFIDDDDLVSHDYVPSVLSVMDDKPDVISFKQHCNYNNKPFDVHFSINHQWTPMDPLKYNVKTESYSDIYRPPFHMCPFRSEISKSERFMKKYDERGQSCEDADWLLRLYPKVKSEMVLDKILHHYNYSSEKTESILK